MAGTFKRILYGGDYNPNQWQKEIWKEDMRIFKDARINTATINVFSWAKIQPAEEVSDFSELDEIIDMLSGDNYEFYGISEVFDSIGGKAGGALWKQCACIMLAY